MLSRSTDAPDSSEPGKLPLPAPTHKAEPDLTAGRDPTPPRDTTPLSRWLAVRQPLRATACKGLVLRLGRDGCASWSKSVRGAARSRDVGNSVLLQSL